VPRGGTGRLRKRDPRRGRLAVRAVPNDRAADEVRVRGWLARVGAPLLLREPVAGRRPPLEEVLAAALELAHRDATVARVLPIVLWAWRGRLDRRRLIRAATRLNERRALGFFLDLTGQLGGDARLVASARRLREERRPRPGLFFTSSRGPAAVAAARRNTPRVAREWGYLIDIGLDSFASAFVRHARGGGEVLREVMRLLEDTLTPRGVGQWLQARNRVLGDGRRPIEVLATGDVEAVRTAAMAYLEGTYV
jgi:hypothetical protein